MLRTSVVGASDEEEDDVLLRKMGRHGPSARDTVRVCVRACGCECVYVSVCVCLCVSSCMHVCVCVRACTTPEPVVIRCHGLWTAPHDKPPFATSHMCKVGQNHIYTVYIR